VNKNNVSDFDLDRNQFRTSNSRFAEIRSTVAVSGTGQIMKKPLAHWWAKIASRLFFLLPVLFAPLLQGAPGVFSITYPGNISSPGPLYATNEIDFQWDASVGAASYELYVRDVTDSLSGPLSTYAVSGTSKRLILYPGSSYKWNVGAYSGTGQSGSFTLSSNSRWLQVGICNLFVPQNVTVTSNPVVAGRQVTVKYRVANGGNGNSVAGMNRIQIKRGSSTVTVVQDDFALPAIVFGQFVDLEAVLTIPSSAVEGSYSVHVLLDTPTNYNVETDYADDTHSEFNIFTVEAALPNLTAYQAPGWDDKIVVSTIRNTTRDSALTSSDNLFVDFGIVNNGNASTEAIFYTQLFIDDIFFNASRADPPMDTGGSQALGALDIDIGKLSEGPHTIKIKIDSGDSIHEGDESIADNEYTKQITVSSTVSISNVSPNGGQVFNNSHPILIGWALSDPTGAVGTIKLEYSLDGGNTYNLIRDDINRAGIGYEWPSECLSSAQVRIRVSVLSSQGAILSFATSANTFEIGPPIANPTARISAPTHASPGTTVTFSAADSVAGNACFPINSYEWTIHDGESITTTSGRTINYQFRSSGNQTINLRVADLDGRNQDGFDSVTVTVDGYAAGGSSPGHDTSHDPVNLANGNYIYEHVDLRLPGKGIPFEFKRFYNSKFTNETSAPLGFGWTHSYNIFLAPLATNIFVTFGDGHVQTYFDVGGDNFIPESNSGIYDQLIKNIDNTWTLVSKDQKRLNFSITGRLASIVDKNGNTIVLSYSGTQLATITDTAGRLVTFSSDANGCIKSVIDPIGRVWRFEYDQNDLVRAIDANDGTNHYSYNENHQLTKGTDARGNDYVQNVYDSIQRFVSSQTDAYGAVTTFSYDFANHVTSMTDAYGKVSTHQFDDRLLVTNIVDEAGRSQSFAYDANRNRVIVRDRNGNESKYSYDDHGNVISKLDAMGGVTSIVYDPLNNPIRRTDALNGVTRFGYDGNGNLTSTTNEIDAAVTVTYDTEGQPMVLTDANGQSTTNIFDGAGNITEIRNAAGFTNRFEYDLVGRKLRHIDARGNTNRFIYDNNGNLSFSLNALNHTNSSIYDANDNLIVNLDARGNGVTNTYDLKGRLNVVRNAYGATISEYDMLDRKVSVTDALGGTTRFAYDDVGQLLFVTNALMGVTSYTYDANGNQITVRNSLGQTVTSYFNALNRLIQTVDSLDHTNRSIYDSLGRQVLTIDAMGRTNAFGFDPSGRLLSVINALGTSVESVSTFQYDPVGNRLSTTDPNGNTTINVFDELNRVVEVHEARGTYRFGYDATGNRVTRVDGNTQSTSFRFDAVNRLEQIDYPSGQAVLFGYDEAGNRTNMIDSLGTSSWQYDKLNRLTNSTDCFGRSVGFALDANGNRTALIYPEDKIVTYAFDENNRMISVTDWLGQVTSYAYNGAGILQAVTNGNGSTILYSYDNANRLTGLMNLAPSGAIFSSFSLDLDAIGNIITSTQTESSSLFLENHVVAYTYSNGNILEAAGGERYSHDANGNMRSKGGSSLFYDFEDRLTRLETLSLTNRYDYDGTGHRVRLTSNGVSKTFVLDVSTPLTQVMAEIDPDRTITAYYIYGLGLISKITVGGETFCYHFDERGNTIALSDTNGLITDKYTYDPFGTQVNTEGSTGNAFRFLGRYGIVDDGNGFLYVRQRYYLPSLGRFITNDPLTGNESDGQTLNRYIYALNNPLRFVDISGLSPSSGTTDETHQHIIDTLLAWAQNVDDLGNAILASGVTVDIVELPIPVLGEIPEGSVLGSVGKGATKLVSFGLRSGVGQKAITSIYVAYREGRVIYVGITDSLKTRAAAHALERGFEITEIMGGMIRSDARAVEQALIEYYGLAKNGGSLLNKINSIAETNPKYWDSIFNGLDILLKNSFHF
jgi:RHS repeat-associated protein